MVALVAVAAAWMGAQVTVQQGRYLQVAGKGLNGGYLLVDDNPRPCQWADQITADGEKNFFSPS